MKGSHYSIANKATHEIKTIPCVLTTIDFTAIADGVIKIYDVSASGDVASGNLVRTITSPGTILQDEVNKVLDLNMNNGLTIVTSVANQDIVIGYE